MSEFKSKYIMILGAEYKRSTDPILLLAEIAEDNGGVLSDTVFSEVVQELELDEDEIMERMAISEIPKFRRFADGWDVSG